MLAIVMQLGVVIICLFLGSMIAAAQPLRIGYIHSEADERLLTSLVTRYESVFRGETAELVPLSRAETERQLAEWLLTGEKADLFLLSDVVVGALRGMQLFRHLEQLRWLDVRIDELYDAFPPGLLDAFSDERGTVGLPLTADAELFQFNADIVADAGVTPLPFIGDDWTWHDMIDIGHAIKGGDPDRYLFDLDLEFAAVYFLAHGPVLSPDGRTATVFNEGNVQLWQLAQEIIHSHRLSLAPRLQGDRHGRFQRGQLVMRSVGVQSMQPGAVDRNKHLWSFDWDVVPWPRSPFSGVRPALGSATGLVIAAGSRALPQAEGFIQVALSKEGQVQAALAGDAFPARADAWTEAMTTGSLSPVGAPVNRAAFVTTITDWQHFLFPTDVEADLERLIMPLAAILEGMLEPEVGIKTFEDAASRLLQQIR